MNPSFPSQSLSTSSSAKEPQYKIKPLILKSFVVKYDSCSFLGNQLDRSKSYRDFKRRGYAKVPCTSFQNNSSSWYNGYLSFSGDQWRHFCKFVIKTSEGYHVDQYRRIPQHAHQMELRSILRKSRVACKAKSACISLNVSSHGDIECIKSCDFWLAKLKKKKHQLAYGVRYYSEASPITSDEKQEFQPRLKRLLQYPRTDLLRIAFSEVSEKQTRDILYAEKFKPKASQFVISVDYYEDAKIYSKNFCLMFNYYSRRELVNRSHHEVEASFETKEFKIQWKARPNGRSCEWSENHADYWKNYALPLEDSKHTLEDPLFKLMVLDKSSRYSLSARIFKMLSRIRGKSLIQKRQCDEEFRRLIEKMRLLALDSLHHVIQTHARKQQENRLCYHDAVKYINIYSSLLQYNLHYNFDFQRTDRYELAIAAKKMALAGVSLLLANQQSYKDLELEFSDKLESVISDLDQNKAANLRSYYGDGISREEIEFLDKHKLKSFASAVVLLCKIVEERWTPGTEKGELSKRISYNLSLANLTFIPGDHSHLEELDIKLPNTYHNHSLLVPSMIAEAPNLSSYSHLKILGIHVNIREDYQQFLADFDHLCDRVPHLETLKLMTFDAD